MNDTDIVDALFRAASKASGTPAAWDQPGSDSRSLVDVLTTAAFEIQRLRASIQEMELQASRAIDDAAYEAEIALQRGIRSRKDGWG